LAGRKDVQPIKNPALLILEVLVRNRWMLFLSLNWSAFQEDPRMNHLTQAHLEKWPANRVVVVVVVVSWGRGPVLSIS